MKTYIIKKEQSPIPVIPGEWNYEESIKRLQPLVYKWKNLTIEVAQELYVAREMLANQGARVDLGTNVPKLTWVFIWIKPSMGIGNYWRVSSGNRAVTLMFSTPLILIFTHAQ